MIKILVADDSAILRNGLKIILEQDKEIEVLGCAENGKEAYEMCKEYNPDIVLMDIRMPVSDGIEGTSLIKSFNENIKVIILTTFDDKSTISKVIEKGADAYVLKDIKDEDLINIIKSAVNGFNIIQGSVYKSIKTVYKPNITAKEKKEFTSIITKREKEIIKLIVDGFDNKEISQKLFIAEGTLRNSISVILNKLELKDRTQLAVFAIRNDIV